MSACSHVVADLPPGTQWTLSRDGKPAETLRSDREGKIVFYSSGGRATPLVFELAQVGSEAAGRRSCYGAAS